MAEVAKNKANSYSHIAEPDDDHEDHMSEDENVDLNSTIDSTKPVKVVQNFLPQLTAIEKLLLKGKYCHSVEKKRNLQTCSG